MFGSARAALLSAVKQGIQGILVGPTVITTSTAATATAYSSQRKIDRCQNGVLWMIYWDGTNNTTTSMRSRYSTDNGVTWIDPGTGSAFGFAGSAPNFTPYSSLFIDKDDYAHVVYKDAGDGYIRYRRGTPNAGRTAWTWTTAYTVGWATTNQCDYPDVIAHQEGTGWVVHCVHSFNNGSFNNAEYRRVTISSSQVITVVGTEPTAISGSYGVNSHVFPSIDFNHTGDGKTVAGGTPHLYVAWSAGATGAGKGIRFKKATYSGGSWTWGTEREIDSTRYIANTGHWIGCLFNGTQVIIPGYLYDGTTWDIILYERDAVDTSTIIRVLIDNASDTEHLSNGSATYDGGNVYLFGRDVSGSNGTRKLNYRKWERAANSLGPIVTIDASTPNSPNVSAKRGYSNNRIEFIYTDDTASPYSIKYGAIK